MNSPEKKQVDARKRALLKLARLDPKKRAKVIEALAAKHKIFLPIKD
jgi:hypothetical protein